MADFKPSFPYSTAIELLIPTYGKVKGTDVKTYPEEGIRLNCSFKTYGGTESVVNGVLSVIDTAMIETWYRPDIKTECRIKVLQTGGLYEEKYFSSVHNFSFAYRWLYFCLCTKYSRRC